MERYRAALSLVLLGVAGCALFLIVEGLFSSSQEITAYRPDRIQSLSSSQTDNDKEVTIPSGEPAMHDDQPAGHLTMKKKPLQRPLVLYPEIEQIRQIEDEILLPYKAISRLQPMLEATDPIIRMAAFESITSLNHPASLSAVLIALDDPKPEIRLLAIDALSMQYDESMVMYIEPLLFDENKRVRVAAIGALSEFENEQAVHALAGLLGDYDMDIRHAVVSALGDIGSETARIYLIYQENEPVERIRVSLIDILHELDAEKR